MSLFICHHLLHVIIRYASQVQWVTYDPLRSGRIALVASGDHKRYVMATCNMKSGDIIKTSGYIPRIAGELFSIDFSLYLSSVLIGTANAKIRINDT